MPLSWITHLDARVNPPEYRVGEVVELLDRPYYSQMEPRGLVARVRAGGQYGECFDPCCHRYEISVIRRGSDGVGGEEYVENMTTSGTALRRPSPGANDLVECQTSPNGGFHSGAHLPRETCTNPRVVSGPLQERVKTIREMYEERVAQAARELEQQRARVPLHRWYYLVGGRYARNVGGTVQSIFFANYWSEGLTLTGTIRHLDGEGSGTYYVEASHLGDPVPTWRLASSLPYGLAMQTPQFAAIVRNGDVFVAHDDSALTIGPDPDNAPSRRGVNVYSIDDDEIRVHECDGDCEAYGCEYQDDNDDDDDDSRHGYSSRSDLIHPYSYTPPLNFRGDDPLYLGVELELATPYADVDTVARQAYRELGELIYLKADCSISPRGFEMVHHPMNYDWAYANYPREALRRLRAAGAFPHTSCGMHIHVSRDGFASPAHTFKWMKWFYRHEESVTLLARRAGSTYAEFGNQMNVAHAKHIAKGAYGAERYSAINATNIKTLEVRVFASTLNVRKLLGAMALVDASTRYNAAITSHDILTKDAWGWGGFKDYVHSFKKYAPLQQEMKRLGV